MDASGQPECARTVLDKGVQRETRYVYHGALGHDDLRGDRLWEVTILASGPRDNVLTTALYEPESSEATVHYQYDKAGRRVASTGSEDCEYQYDGEGNLTQEYCADFSGFTPYEQSSSYRYDEDGRLIEEVTRATFSSPEKTVYRHGANGCVTEELRYDADDVLEARFTYQCDSQGRPLRQTYHPATGGSHELRTYLYDENGLLVGENKFEDSGLLENRVTYEHDEHGRVIRRTKWDATNAIDWVKDTFYIGGRDEDHPESEEIRTYEFGKTVVEVTHDGDGYPARISARSDDELAQALLPVVEFRRQGGELIQTTHRLDRPVQERTYDESGHLLKETVLGSDGELLSDRVFELTYSRQGNLTQETITCDGPRCDSDETGTVSYTYDKNGDVVSARERLGGADQATETTLRYERNDRGHWTRKLQLEDGEITRLVDRRIEY